MRYADDCNIFVRTDVAAERVMKSVTSWLERKLFLKVSATKTKITRPSNSNFLILYKFLKCGKNNFIIIHKSLHA